MSVTLPDEAFAEGNILFLKSWAECISSGYLQYNVERGAYGHPAVVLRLKSNKTDVVICTVELSYPPSVYWITRRRRHTDIILPKMTSLGDSSLSVHPQAQWNDYCAVFPMPPPSPAYPQLRLINGVSLRKSSYVNLKQCYVVHRHMIQLFDNERPWDYYRLDGISYCIVAGRFGISGMVVNPSSFYDKERRMKELNRENKLLTFRCQLLEDELRKWEEKETLQAALRLKKQWKIPRADLMSYICCFICVSSLFGARMSPPAWPLAVLNTWTKIWSDYRLGTEWYKKTRDIIIAILKRTTKPLAG